jgi:hypothetical protein
VKVVEVVRVVAVAAAVVDTAEEVAVVGAAAEVADTAEVAAEAVTKPDSELRCFLV